MNWRPVFLFLWMTLSFVLDGCNKPDELPDGRPRVLSMTLMGIPPENISIDQRNNQIRVLMPTQISTFSLEPRFTTTPNVKVETNLTATIDRVSCRGEPLLISAIDLTTQDRLDYQLILQPTGPLQVDFNRPNYQIADAEGIQLKIQNFQYGSSPTEVVLTRQGSNPLEQIIITDCSSPMGEVTASKEAGLFVVKPSSLAALKPGNYQVLIRQGSGRQATASQPLAVEPGKPFIDNPNQGRRAQAGEVLTLEGYNLFAENKLEIWLSRPGLPVFKYKPLAVTSSGNQLQFQIGRDVPVGYYALSLLVDGQPYPLNTDQQIRLAIIKESKQPSIVFLGPSSGRDSYGISFSSQPVKFAQESTPVVMNKQFPNQTELSFGSAPFSVKDVKMYLKLESVARPGAVYLTPFELDLFHWEAWTHKFSYFQSRPQIPAEVPPGKYHLSLVLEEIQSQQRHESLPYERVVDIQP